MKFDPKSSFSKTMAQFRDVANGLDAECARIFFDNVSNLRRTTPRQNGRIGATAFRQAVLFDLRNLEDRRSKVILS